MPSGFAHIVLSMCLIFKSVIAQGIPKKSADMKKSIPDDSALLAGCYEEMYRCMIAKDTASLGKLLDGNFVLVHMTGMRQPKAEFLRSIANGTLNYYSRLEVSIHGDTARMTGRSLVNAGVFGGGRYTWPLQVVGSIYWNIAYDRLPGEAMKDEEGVANMKNLGQNIA